MKKGIVAILSAAAGAVLSTIMYKKKYEVLLKMSEKHLALYLMMNQWVKVKQENKSIAKYLEAKGYREVAIYGMNYVGETLLNELTGTNVIVKYGIDKEAERMYKDIDVLLPDDELPEVDLIIVTPITFWEEIKEKLSAKINCTIMSMEDILYEV